MRTLGKAYKLGFLEGSMAEFGLSRGKKIWNEYIEKYVIIYSANHQSTFCGKLVRIEDGYGVLNPH